MNSKQKTGFIEGGMAVVLDKAPRLSISIVIWINQLQHSTHVMDMCHFFVLIREKPILILGAQDDPLAL